MGNCLEKLSKKLSDDEKTYVTKEDMKKYVSTNNLKEQQPSNEYKIINDRFGSFTELEEGLRKAGLESSQLIVGIDFTRSNTWQGGLPYFHDKNLHAMIIIHQFFIDELSWNY